MSWIVHLFCLFVSALVSLQILKTQGYLRQRLHSLQQPSNVPTVSCMRTLQKRLNLGLLICGDLWYLW